MDLEKTDKYEVIEIFEALGYEIPDVISELLCSEHKK